MKGIAFFDFDNTIIQGDAGPMFAKHLLHLDVDSTWQRLALWLRYTPFLSSMAAQAALYRLGARRRSSIVRSAYKGLRGIEVAPFQEALRAFSKEVAARAYPAMKKEIAKHAKAGRAVVVVTTGMEVLVTAAMAHIAPRTTVIGCELLARDGRLTGEVRGPLYGVDKANIIRAYCKAKGVDPKLCYAYTDHYSDHAMLEAVGHGVVVHPRGRLASLASRRGYRIMRP